GTAISVYTMRSNIEEETLQPCKMTMWYCKSGDERLDEAEENAYKKIISDFNTSLEDVEIELVGFMPDEYAAKLSSSDKQPNIYEYTDTLSSAARLSLDKVYASDEMKQCSVLNNAEQAYGNKYQLPLGFDVPVVYANTGLCDYGKDGVSDLSQIMGKVRPEYEPLVFSSKDYNSIFGDADEYYSENAKEKFLDKNDKICFFGGYTSDYYDVRDKLPVQYKILYCDVDEVPCEYEDVWCANDISKDENRASEKLLGFMLTNNAQDALHVQNQSLSLPVNDAVRDVFVGVHEEFDGTFVNTDKYVFSND
ncbi:MAG: hypothetical protein J6Z29_11580, partial [Ruminococcus sp.]|nr:hypothetical protein [Ruminococcus sp.]